MTNTRTAPITPASYLKASVRFSRSPLIRLSGDLMPYVLDEIVLTARRAKIAIDKLSEKQLQDAIHTAKATHESFDAIADTMDVINEAAAVREEDDIPAPDGLHDASLTDEEEDERARIEAAADPAIKVTIENGFRTKGAATESKKQVHSSHLHCGHASTKVARAKCRRNRNHA